MTLNHRFWMSSLLVLGMLALATQARTQDNLSPNNRHSNHGYVPTSGMTQTRYLYAADPDSIDSPIYYKIDPSSGEVVDTLDNIPRVSDASGVAVVGTTMYYLVGGDSNVYKYNLTTHSDEGLAFGTGLGQPGPSTLAFDGVNFWIGGAFGSNNAYLYSPAGTLLKTLTLSACTGGCQGLEYVVMHGGTFLIANEDNGFGSPTYYDIYDLNGNLVRSHFITVTSGGNSGVAWDGANFWTADTFALSISEWDANGNFIQTVPVTGWGLWPPYLTDMSFDYTQTLASAVWRTR